MILIDTNIFVYALDTTSIFHEKSKSIVFAASEDLCTTSKNISELFVVLSRNGYTAEELISAYNLITSQCDIFFPDSNSLQLFLSMLKLYNYKGKRIHDLEIASIALSNNVAMIATENIEDFQDIEPLEIFVL